MTNTNMLKIIIRESGYRINYVAKQVGVTYQGFLNKLNNKSEFRQSEILALCNLLHIDSERRDLIFFNQNVSKMGTDKERD